MTTYNAASAYASRPSVSDDAADFLAQCQKALSSNRIADLTSDAMSRANAQMRVTATYAAAAQQLVLMALGVLTVSAMAYTGELTLESLREGPIDTFTMRRGGKLVGSLTRVHYGPETKLIGGGVTLSLSEQAVGDMIPSQSPKATEEAPAPTNAN